MQREFDRNTKNCNKYVIMNCHYIIDNRTAFENNNTPLIKQELRNIMNKIDRIVNKRYINITDLKNDVYNKNNPMIDMIKDFLFIITTYTNNHICKQGDREYVKIIRNYLCLNGCKNMNNLYHFIANVGIIMSGCSRIYINIQDSSNFFIIFSNTCFYTTFRYSIR